MPWVRTGFHIVLALQKTKNYFAPQAAQALCGSFFLPQFLQIVSVGRVILIAPRRCALLW
jgi:hypothetical protein